MGFHLVGEWWGAVFYPIANFLFLSVAGVLIFRFTNKEGNESPLFRYQRIQIFLIMLVVLLHVFLLIGQFPDHGIAANPVTVFLHQQVAYFLSAVSDPLHACYEELAFSEEMIKKLDAGSVNVALCVLLPLLLLLPFSRRRHDYYLNRFNWKLLLMLFSLYAPFFFMGGRKLGIIMPFTLTYAFLAAIPEEFLYRALFQGRLESFSKNKLNSITIAALVFGFMHLPVNAGDYDIHTGIAFCLGGNAFGGFLIGYLFYRTRSLWMAILLHLWAGVATNT